MTQRSLQIITVIIKKIKVILVEQYQWESKIWNLYEKITGSFSIFDESNNNEIRNVKAVGQFLGTLKNDKKNTTETSGG